MAFVFVGEKRSRKAVDLGVTWKDGRLAAKTLFRALRAAGIEPDPDVHKFVNLFEDGDGWQVDWAMRDGIRRWSERGWTVVALGERVQRELEAAGIGYVPLVHPAARGLIRARARYDRHVAEMLGGVR